MRMRLFADALVVVVFFLLPYWVSLPVLLGALFYFDIYIEGAVIAFFVDAFYNPFPTGNYFHGFLTTISLIIILGRVFLKPYLRS